MAVGMFVDFIDSVHELSHRGSRQRTMA